jgi:hypothetical protein
MSSITVTPATLMLQQSADASSIETAAASDVFKTAELHQRFVQDIRWQLESEHNTAVDAEIDGNLMPPETSTSSAAASKTIT